MSHEEKFCIYLILESPAMKWIGTKHRYKDANGMVQECPEYSNSKLPCLHNSLDISLLFYVLIYHVM
jgi:hypothetical protein